METITYICQTVFIKPDPDFPKFFYECIPFSHTGYGIAHLRKFIDGRYLIKYTDLYVKTEIHREEYDSLIEAIDRMNKMTGKKTFDLCNHGDKKSNPCHFKYVSPPDWRPDKLLPEDLGQ